MADLQAVIDKVLSDESFREALVENPAKTLESVGVEPTPEILGAFEGVDKESLKELAASFDPTSAAA